MKKKDELKYFDETWEDMQICLVDFCKHEQEESLHQFRVLVKKISAFITLVGSMENKNPFKGLLKPLSKIFKKAGEIRNAQINLQLCKTHQLSNQDFIDSQQELLDTAIPRFKEQEDDYIEKLATVYKAVKKKLKPVPNLHFYIYCNIKLHMLSDALQKDNFDEQLHNCRKIIKVLMYNYKLANARTAITINKEYLDDVQTAIGNWHDSALMIELLSVNAPKDKLVINSLKTNHDKQRDKVYRIVRDFYTNATTVVDLPLEQID